MAFDSLVNRLIPEGAVMAGNRPKTILADDGGPGSEPGYYDTSPTGNLLRNLQKFQMEQAVKDEEFRIKEEKRIEKEKKRADMYKTLRDSGYEPKKAYEAVLSSSFPQEAGGETLSETKNKAEVNKINAQAGKETAIKEKTQKQTELLTSSKSTLRQRILDKVANDEELTPGEQKVYDEVIKARGDKEAPKVKDEPVKKEKAEEMVKMLDPLGRKKLVPKSNVKKAKAKGWKLRE